MGLVGSQMVSPVFVCLSPNTPTMLPAVTDSLRSRSLACIRKIRDTFSLMPLVGFRTSMPAVSVPEYRRTNTSRRPSSPIIATLNASPASGAFGSCGRVAGSFVLGSTPSISGTSSGDGSHCTMAFNSGWMPLLRSAAPHSTGTSLLAITARRMAAWISLVLKASGVSSHAIANSSSAMAMRSNKMLRAFSTSSSMSAGTSMSS